MQREDAMTEQPLGWAHSSWADGSLDAVAVHVHHIPHGLVLEMELLQLLGCGTASSILENWLRRPHSRRHEGCQVLVPQHRDIAQAWQALSLALGRHLSNQISLS